MRDELFYHTRIEYKVLVERKESMRIEITKFRNDAFKQMCLSYPGKVWAPLELNIPSRWIREDGFANKYIWTKGLFKNMKKILERRYYNKYGKPYEPLPEIYRYK